MILASLNHVYRNLMKLSHIEVDGTLVPSLNINLKTNTTKLETSEILF